MERSKFYVEEVLAHYDFCLQRQRPFSIVGPRNFIRGNRAWFWPTRMREGKANPLSKPLFFPCADFECRNIAILFMRRLDAWFRLPFFGRHLWGFDVRLGQFDFVIG